MDINALRNSAHLSVSSINQYLDCSLAYRFAKIDRIQPEHIPEAMVLGTALHRIVEFYHNERLIGVKPSLLDLTHIFEQLWRQEVEKTPNIQFKDGRDGDTALLEGKSLLAAYVSQFPETGLKVIAIEEPFSFTVENVPIPLIGAIDMIEEDEAGNIVIVDLKTSSRSYSPEEIDRNFQLTVYGLAAKEIGFKGREVLFRFDCLVKTKKPKLEQYYSSRASEDERRAMKKIQSVYEAISKKVFIPNDNSWRCKTCLYQNACQAWFQ